MARFSSLADCTDPVVRPDESDLEAADRHLITLCRNRGVDLATAAPDADGLELLRMTAVAYALSLAAQRSAADSADGVMWKKYDTYRTQARDLGLTVNRESLGVTVAGSGSAGFASIPTGRG